MGPHERVAATSSSTSGEGEAFTVVLYYKYVTVAESDAELDTFLREHEQLCQSLALRGRVRIALEGINGTLGGRLQDVSAYMTAMQRDPRFGGIDWKTSASSVEPFGELLVRRTDEIVALGLPSEQCNPSQTATHLSPHAFHHAQEESAPDSYALIDVRNTYEYNIGHFEGAINPQTRRFSQFPEWVRNQLPVLQQKDKILMYCTGGIRCEKASAYLQHLGLRNVYQLDGGIHRYLEQYPAGGRFQGKNFVFDQRVAMASEDERIAGRCEPCQQPYDVVSGVRCAYCRTHVLVCDQCREALGQEEHVYCRDHAWLVAGTLAELQARVQQLRDAMAQEMGHARKGKRRSLRKQIDTVEARIRMATPLA